MRNDPVGDGSETFESQVKDEKYPQHAKCESVWQDRVSARAFDAGSTDPFNKSLRTRWKRTRY